MLRLNFYLWRRDVAIRKLAKLRAKNVRYAGHDVKEAKAESRAKRWQLLASIAEARLLGVQTQTNS